MAPAQENSLRPDDFDNLIRVLSHQLKDPINSIESMLNVVLEGFTGSVDSKTSHYIRKAVGKTQETRRLISDLLRYEQFSTGREITFEQINLGDFLAAIVHGYIPAAAEKNISLNFEAPEGLRAVVQGSRAGLESAFRNLIDNALKYTADGGEVGVAFEIDRSLRVCRIAVRDTGCGIAPNDIPHLFEPFFRSLSSKGTVAGTGLGLAIVKRVAERHGGGVAVTSAVGKGTTVTLTLPSGLIEEAHAAVSPGKRVVIVGGVTAGPKAAARLRRLDESMDITIIEKSEFLSYAGCGIPSYVRGTVKSPRALMSTSDNTLRDVNFFESIKNIKILNKTEAVRIDREKKEVVCRLRGTDVERKIGYDVLILATGARSVIPAIKGINAPGVCSLYNIEDAETIKRRFADRPASDVCILGGGLIGIETAESLLMAGGRITVLEKDACILKMIDNDIAQNIEQALSGKGIKVVTGVAIQEITQAGSRHTIATDKGNFEADLIILSAGVKPNSVLADQAGLALGTRGGIVVNRFLRTSDPSIYAIGDCAESRHLISGRHNLLPLGSVSTRMGRIAADNIAGKRTEFPGCLGTVMFKLFDIQIAQTGLTVREARESGFDPVSVIVAGLDRAHYESDAQQIVLKVVADRKTQRLLGVQGYGRGEVARRIGVLAAAISAHFTIEKMFLIDLGYFPAFNNPIDIAQIACLVLKSKIEGACKFTDNEEFERIRGEVGIVDVSPPQDYSFNSIPGSINVPLENLRSEGIPYEKTERIVVYSKTSSRAYEACRYLDSCGFENISILEGGLVFWKG